MTIRAGDHYTVETLSQFRRRLEFDADEILVALSEDPDFDREILQDLAGKGYENVGAIPEEEAREYLGAYNVSHNRCIQAVLERDHREWIHLFDGHVHNLVELHPKSR
jgi:hypothetical protein